MDRWSWPVCKFVHTPYMNAEHIFPTQQRDVELLVEYCKQFPQIKRVTIFGSSTTWLCTQESDIDVYIEGAGGRPKGFCPPTEDEVDLWWDGDFDIQKNSRFMAEIRKGVVVYEV